MDDQSKPQSPPRQWSDEQRRRAEEHRAFVREMDNRLGNAYGRGGGLVVLVGCMVVAIGWIVGWLGQPALWLGAITATLAALYGVRKRIYAHRRTLRRQVDDYCQVNGLSVELLRQYYESQQMYPFFAAIYEQVPTRSEESTAGDDSPHKGDDR